MREGDVRAGSRAWDLAALCVAALICAVTLVPGGRSDSPTELGLRGPALADAARNLVLFAPLGAALALGAHPARRIAVRALALSAVIEVLQLAIPGRWTTFSDLICNTSGALVGCALIFLRSWWLAPPPRAARVLCAAALLATWAVPVLTGYLFAPDLPVGLYFGGWTPEIGGLAVYSGRVLEARVGEVSIPVGGPALDSAPLRKALLARAPIHLRWQVGPPPERLAPLVHVIGPTSQEVLLVGVRHSDVLMRTWRRSADVLLEQPELIWPGALDGLDPGRVAVLRLTPVRGGALLALENRAEWHAGTGPARGWALFGRDRWVPAGLRRWFDALWLAGLLFPVGLWLPRGGAGLAVAGASLASLAVVPPLVGLARAVAWDWLAACAGLLAGRLLRAWTRVAR